jgi:uncharacterized membrane protein required for colicin V production
MNVLNKLPVNWFDFVLVIVLIAGIQRGRKRGMSEELLSVLKWVTIVVVCALAYQQFGKFLADATVFSLLASYLMAYLALALIVAVLFVAIKRSLGGKLLGSEIFGQTEYYLGMLAGALRFACIVIFVLALLNARLYTDEEVRAETAYQKDVYGSEFFPGLHTAQAAVFERSFFGPMIQKNFGFLLIKPTPPQRKEIRRKELNLP